ncbi:hypothetical protein IMG5_144790, partial [Ichthyophthirius multifiliis]
NNQTQAFTLFLQSSSQYQSPIESKYSRKTYKGEKQISPQLNPLKTISLSFNYYQFEYVLLVEYLVLSVLNVSNQVLLLVSLFLLLSISYYYNYIYFYYYYLQDKLTSSSFIYSKVTSYKLCKAYSHPFLFLMLKYQVYFPIFKIIITFQNQLSIKIISLSLKNYNNYQKAKLNFNNQNQIFGVVNSFNPYYFSNYSASQQFISVLLAIIQLIKITWLNDYNKPQHPSYKQ